MNGCFKNTIFSVEATLYPVISVLKGNVITRLLLEIDGGVFIVIYCHHRALKVKTSIVVRMLLGYFLVNFFLF